MLITQYELLLIVVGGAISAVAGMLVLFFIVSPIIQRLSSKIELPYLQGFIATTLGIAYWLIMFVGAIFIAGRLGLVD